MRDDIYLVDVVARARDDERATVETLRSLQVATPSGRTVPLSQFVTFEYGQDFPLVWLRDRADFPGFNAVYAEYFPTDPPARSAVVSDLLVDVRVEVEVVAWRPLGGA